MGRVMVVGGSRDRFTASGHQLVEGATTNAEGFGNRAAYLVVFDRAFARKRIDYVVLVGRRRLLLFGSLGGESLLRLFCKRCEPIVSVSLSFFGIGLSACVFKCVVGHDEHHEDDARRRSMTAR